MNEKQAELKIIEDKVQALTDELTRLQNFLKELTDKATDTMIKKERADKLIEGLGGEKHRWNDSVTILRGQFESLTGDILVSSGVVA